MNEPEQPKLEVTPAEVKPDETPKIIQVALAILATAGWFTGLAVLGVITVTCLVEIKSAILKLLQ